MSSPQDQYAKSLRTSQEAVVEAVKSWTKSAQIAFGTPPGSPSGPFDPNQVIDQVFDFVEQMLAVQREFAKTLAATAPTGAAVARQTASTGAAVAKQTAPTGPAGRKQTASAGPRKGTNSVAASPRSQPRVRKGRPPHA
jgi:hypothetical protein